MKIRIRGGMPAEAPSWLEPAQDDSSGGTTLLIDDAQLVIASGEGDAVGGLWTSHPLLVLLARRALVS